MDTYKNAMREDEYNEVQILEAKERLKEEIEMLDRKAYRCKVNDYLHDAMQYEAMAYIKQEKLDKL